MKLILVFIIAVALTAILINIDYGFYNPSRGVVSAGREELPKDQRERELLHLTVTVEDQRRLGTVPTLAQLSAFYGAEDSLPCSVRRTFASDDLKLAGRPRPPGAEVTICLD